MTDDEPKGSPYTPDRAWLNAYPDGSTLVHFSADDHPDWEFLLAGLDRDLTWASFRPYRHGGYSASDRALQQQLFLIVGAITVAAGHAEADMKRILLAHDEDKTKHYADTASTWSDMVKALRSLATSDPTQKDLADLLDWAAQERVTEIRNGAVHSYWWLFDVGHVHRGRIALKAGAKQDAAHMGSLDDYFGQASLMFEFATRLQSIVPWPTAILPPLDHPGVAAQPIRWPWPPDLEGAVTNREDPSGRPI